MGYNWKTCPSEIKNFIFNLQKSIKEIINDNDAGLYIHGSLAMGGFNPKKKAISIFWLLQTNPYQLSKEGIWHSSF